MEGKRFATAIASIAGVLMIPGSLWAHHSRAGFYQDPESRITLHGTVVEMRWQNPHAYIVLDGAPEGGEVTRWTIELGSPGNLTQRNTGWSHDVLKPGDEVSITTSPAIDGRNVALGAHVVFADGRQGPYEFELDGENGSPPR